MKKTLLSFGLVLAAAAPLAAQNINNSSQAGTQITISTVSGIFGGGSGSAGGLGSIAVANLVTPTSLSASISPLTGGAPTVAAAVAVNNLIAGSPGQQIAAATQMAGQLSAAGLNGPAAVALLKAMAGLGRGATPAKIAGAISAYNALVASAPASALQSPPPALVAIHAALTALARGMNR